MVKQQHYVPQFYLNNFFENKDFYVGNIINKTSFKSNSLKVSKQNKFYDNLNFDSIVQKEYLPLIKFIYGNQVLENLIKTYNNLITSDNPVVVVNKIMIFPFNKNYLIMVNINENKSSIQLENDVKNNGLIMNNRLQIDRCSKFIFFHKDLLKKQ